MTTLVLFSHIGYTVMIKTKYSDQNKFIIVVGRSPVIVFPGLKKFFFFFRKCMSLVFMQRQIEKY